jgi:hypothetical protein
MQPGTRMPTVFPNGTTALKSLLGGNGIAQSDAIWEYLSLGTNLPLPEGLEPPRGLTLEAKDRPLVVRTFMPDAGTHAFAVGFPGGVSFAFDATRCRLAYGWTGSFLNAGPIWNDRGGSPAGVLGPRFWTAPAGFPWSFSDSLGTPPPNWTERQSDPAFGAPVGEGKLADAPPRLRFLRYTLASDGRPTFHYALTHGSGDAKVSHVEIRERFEPRQELAGVGVVRRFELQPPKPGVAWLLVAQSSVPPRFLSSDGGEIEWDHSTGAIDHRVDVRHVAITDGAGVRLARVVTAPAGAQWSVRKHGNDWHTTLQVPNLPDGPSAVAICIWTPYRNDAAMIRDLIQTMVK